jgi:hypothetical protein
MGMVDGGMVWYGMVMVLVLSTMPRTRIAAI